MNFKSAFDLVSHVLTAVVFVVTAVEANATGAGDGAAKKAEAVRKVLELVSGQVPELLRPLLPLLVGLLIDGAVAYANGSGIFRGAAKPA